MLVRCIWFCIAFLPALSALHALDLEPVVISSGVTSDFGGRVEYLVDDSGREDLAAAAQSARWTRMEHDSLNLGFEATSIWIRFAIKNQTNAEKLFLKNDYPPVDHLNLFYTDPRGNAVITHSGDMIPMSLHPVRSRTAVFPVDVRPGSTSVIYLHLRSKSSIQFVPSLFTADEYPVHAAQEFLYVGAYFGIFAIMALYNFFLFLSVKDVSYLAYVFSTIATGLAQFCLNGLVFLFFLPEKPGWNQNLTPISLGLGAFFFFLFSELFLHTGKYSRRAALVMRGIAGTSVVVVLASVFLDYRTATRVAGGFAGIVCPVVLIAVAFLVARRGHGSTRYFLLACSVFVVGTLIRGLKNFGGLPSTFLTEHGQEIGSVVEVVLLSMALGDRINAMRREREANRTKLQKQQRLASVGQVAASMAHDLRGSLAVIHGYAEFVRDLPGPDAREFATAIEGEVRHMQAMATDILDFVRGEIRLQKETRDAAAFIRDFVEPLKRAADEKGIQILSRIDEIGPANLDYARMRRVLSNLITNAMDVVPPGTGCIEIGARASNGELRIDVKDNGPGIPESIQTNLFEPFVTHGKGSGSGLGTAIAKKVVDEHGGRIWFESHSGGTTFHIGIPVAT